MNQMEKDLAQDKTGKYEEYCLSKVTPEARYFILLFDSELSTRVNSNLHSKNPATFI